MRIRTVIQEWEAKLQPVDPRSQVTRKVGFAKAEWKVYEEGERRCKLIVSKLDLPDGVVLEIDVDGQQFDNAVVRGGRIEYRRETEKGESVHDVAVDQLLHVTYGGEPILEGRFYEE